MDNQEFDSKLFQELVERIKQEYPKLDTELCQYIAGSYILFDLKKEKPSSVVIETEA